MLASVCSCNNNFCHADSVAMHALEFIGKRRPSNDTLDLGPHIAIIPAIAIARRVFIVQYRHNIIFPD